jgi:3-methyladenine DNA glycosylase/8-oxoguanine DNA glycosylase
VTNLRLMQLVVYGADVEVDDRHANTPALAERWRPYRSLAVSYLFAAEFEEGT